MKIVCDSKVRFLEGVFNGVADIEFVSGHDISSDILKNADALIVRTRTCCNQKLLEGSNVKFIGTATIGYDHIDTEYCNQNNIFWTNAPGCNSGSVCQYIVAALYSLVQHYKLQFSKITLGVIGAGHVGSKVIKAAKLLGINVLVNDPPLQDMGCSNFDFCNLDTLLCNADIVDIHVPYSTIGKYATHHLCNRDFLSKIKQGAILINTSRGAVADNNAVLEALKSHQLLTAVLDVWENEPDINLQLLQEVFIGTPHIAGYSVDGKANATMQIVRSLSHFFNLGLDNFVPDTHLFQAFSLNYNNITDYNAVVSSYNIIVDSLALKSNPEQFELLREHYLVRRESL